MAGPFKNGGIKMEKKITQYIVEYSANDLWANREFFDFKIDNIEQAMDYVRIGTRTFENVDDVNYTIGFSIYSLLGLKIDDIIEKDPIWREKAIKIITSSSLKEMLEFTPKPGEENKCYNTIMYMGHSLASRSRIRDSEILYKEYINEFVKWFEGATLMVDFTNKKGPKTFAEYRKIRLIDCVGQMLLWQVGRLHHDLDIKADGFEGFAAYFYDHVGLGNDYHSLSKTSSQDLDQYKSLEDFKDCTLEEIKSFLDNEIKEIEQKMMDYEKIDQFAKDVLIQVLWDLYYAEKAAMRYNNIMKNKKNHIGIQESINGTIE